MRTKSVDRGAAAALAGLAALAVCALTAGQRGRSLDRSLFRVLNRDRGPVADAALRGVTELGSIWASAGAALALAATGRRREAVDAFGAAGTMWLVGQILKRAVRRPRPYSSLDRFRLMIDRPRGTSWPSSHPAVFLAFATVACRELDSPLALRGAADALAGVVGASRIYLGVHYPADVAGGLLLGRAVADGWTALVSPHMGPR